MLNILLNGEHISTSHQNLDEIIRSLALEGKRFAVELNENIIPKSKLSSTLIKEHDRIEIIQAVGGG